MQCPEGSGESMFASNIAETEVDAVDKRPTGSIALDATPITRKGPLSSIDDADNTTAQEASEISNDDMSEDDAKKVILNHPLPKARQRTNIVSDNYVRKGGSSEHLLLGARVSLKLLFVFLLL